MKKRKHTKGKLWWQSLTSEQKQEYIERKELSRASNRKRGKDETWTNASGTFTKKWLSDDSYAVERHQNNTITPPNK